VQYQVAVSQPLPAISSRTQDVGANGFDTTDSDANAGTGKTQIITLASGEYNPTLDAGVYQTAHLGDRLWVDTNHDGLQNDGADGIVGATVTLIGGGRRWPDQRRWRHHHDDHHGRRWFLRLRRLDAGRAVSGCSSPPLPAISSPRRTLEPMASTRRTSDANAGTGKTQIITLSSGEYNPTLDAGVYQDRPSRRPAVGRCHHDGKQNDGATGIVGATVTLIGGGAEWPDQWRWRHHRDHHHGRRRLLRLRRLDAGRAVPGAVSQPLQAISSRRRTSEPTLSTRPTSDANTSTGKDPDHQRSLRASTTRRWTRVSIRPPISAIVLWVDTNHDGKQNDGATGIVGATVTLIGGGADGPHQWRWRHHHDHHHGASTAVYDFAGLDAGACNIRLQFSATGGLRLHHPGMLAANAFDTIDSGRQTSAPARRAKSSRSPRASTTRRSMPACRRSPSMSRNMCVALYTVQGGGGGERPDARLWKNHSIIRATLPHEEWTATGFSPDQSYEAVFGIVKLGVNPNRRRMRCRRCLTP